MARKTAKKAKKTKKVKKAVRKAAARKAPARKTKTAKTKKPAKKVARKAAAKTVRKAATKKAARKTAKKTRGDVKGEGNYSASRRFRKSEEGFIKRMGRKIADLGHDAKVALTGPEGKDLEAAEASTRARGEGMDVPGDE